LEKYQVRIQALLLLGNGKKCSQQFETCALFVDRVRGSAGFASLEGLGAPKVEWFFFFFLKEPKVQCCVNLHELWSKLWANIQYYSLCCFFNKQIFRSKASMDGYFINTSIIWYSLRSKLYVVLAF
jgi:hypothetical protein